MMGHISQITNWHYGFRLMSILNVIGIIFIWVFLPSSKNFKNNNNDDIKYLKILTSHLTNSYLIISACTLGFCILFSLVSYFIFINIYLSQHPLFKLNSADLSNIFMVYLLGLIITPLSSRLITKYGIIKVTYISIILSIT